MLVAVFSLLAGRAFAAKFDIPAQTAPSALQLFIKQSGMNVLFVYDDLRAVKSNPVAGDLAPLEALKELLSGTGFTATKRGDGNFVVARDATHPTGSIEGVILPPPSAPKKSVAGIQVTLVETGSIVTLSESGRYRFDHVEPGTYTLIAAGEGYSRLRIAEVGVEANHSLIVSPEAMPIVMKGGEIQVMAEVVVRPDREVQTLEKYVVEDEKPQPFSDRNVDLPRTVNDVQPYYIFTNQQMEESGSQDVEDFLKQHLTMDTTSRTNRQTGNSVSAAQNGTNSSINLEGLGADHTLILVNGLPMPGVSFFNGTNQNPAQPDVNGLPFSAIDRIEVLPTSAGAIYGGSATGGVINIILKKAYTGGELKVSYGGTTDGYAPSRTVEATVGKSFEGGKTQIMITAQYMDQQTMTIADRASILNRGYSRVLAGEGSVLDMAFNFGPPIGRTTNIISDPYYQNGTGNLTLKNGTSLNSPVATLPVGYSGDTSTIIPGQFNFTNPPTNQIPNGLSRPLDSVPRKKSLLATLTRQMTPNLQLHVDFTNTENHSTNQYNFLGTFEPFPGASPFNPFAEDVDVSVPLNINAPQISQSNANSITVGGTLKLPFNWAAHLDYQWSTSSFQYQADSLIVAAAIATTPTFGGTYKGVVDNYPTPFFTGAINPFADTVDHPIDMLPFMETSFQKGKTVANDLVFAASGPIFHLPWGDPRLSTRLEHNRTGQPQGAINSFTPASTPYQGLPLPWYTDTSFGQVQTTDSANGQLDLPVFKTKLPLLRSLDLQLNFSSETATVGTGSPGFRTANADYAFNMATTGLITVSSAPTTPPGAVIVPNGTPLRSRTVESNTSFTGPALAYRPIDDLIIRFSTGTGFVPPTYSQLAPNLSPTSYPQFINDPKNPKNGTRLVGGLEEYSVPTYQSGNPTLAPETSRSWNAGAVWEPRKGLLRGLRADAEFIETKQHNVIFAPSAQYLVNFESDFPGAVVRSPTTGLITQINISPVNLNEAKNELWNLTLDYSRPTEIGTFGLSLAETIEEHNQQQVAAGQPFLEFVGFPNGGAGDAKTKATGTLRWSWHTWVASWTVVSFDSYKQYGAPGDPNTTNHGVYVEQGSTRIPSQTYNNVYVAYTFKKDRFTAFGRWAGSFLDNVTLSLSVNDVFNTVPPYDAYNTPFYTSTFGDIQLRTFLVTVKKAW